MKAVTISLHILILFISTIGVFFSLAFIPDALDRYKHEYEDLIGVLFFMVLGSIFIVHSIVNLFFIKNGYPQKNTYIFKALSVIVLSLAILFLILGIFEENDRFLILLSGLLLFLSGYSGFTFYGANKNT